MGSSGPGTPTISWTPFARLHSSPLEVPLYGPLAQPNKSAGVLEEDSYRYPRHPPSNEHDSGSARHILALFMFNDGFSLVAVETGIGSETT